MHGHQSERSLGEREALYASADTGEVDQVKGQDRTKKLVHDDICDQRFAQSRTKDCLQSYTSGDFVQLTTESATIHCFCEGQTNNARTLMPDGGYGKVWCCRRTLETWDANSGKSGLTSFGDGTPPIRRRRCKQIMAWDLATACYRAHHSPTLRLFGC